MPLLLLFLLVLIIAYAPLDFQYWLAGGVRDLITHPYFPYVAAGAVGATVAALVWYSVIWNALAYRIYLDDVAKAEDTYRKRRR